MHSTHSLKCWSSVTVPGVLYIFCEKQQKLCNIVEHNDTFIPASLWVRDTEQKSSTALKLCKDPAVSYGS